MFIAIQIGPAYLLAIPHRARPLLVEEKTLLLCEFAQYRLNGHFKNFADQLPEFMPR